VSPQTGSITAAPTKAWRAVVMAMAKSGGGSAASGLLSALGAKIIAAMLGPTGTALVSTLQQTRDAAVVAATANGRTALVQGMSAFDPVSRREYLRTSLIIFSAGVVAAACIMVIARERVAQWAGLPPGTSALFAWLAIPVVLTSGFVFLCALANVLGEIGKLAWSQVAVSAVAVACAWPAARLVQEGLRGALDAWLSMTAVAGLAAGLWMIARHRATLRTWIDGQGRWWSWPAARHFFSISGAMMATGLLGSMIVIGLRAHVIRVEGLNSAGWFDAAWTISMRHVTLVLSSLQTYYLPALARARDAEERSAQMARVLMVTTAIMAPLVTVVAAANPLVLALLYSDAFRPAGALLRWTLVGDYLKVTSWVLAMPMLAVADMKVFLATDLTVQVVFAGSAVMLGRVFRPSLGTAIAFVVSYAVNLAICYTYARVRHAYRPPRAVTASWWVGLSMVVAAAALS
jgi:O-antigen/teichoic acid export membrane protein